MAAKGSAMSRAIRFFREADVDECKFVLMRGTEILNSRIPESAGPKPVRKAKKTRATRTNAAETEQSTSDMPQVT